MFAIFNKDGEFLYISDNEPVDSKYLCKELEKEFVIGRHTYEGDFETGCIVNIEDDNVLESGRNVIVNLSSLKQSVTESIESKYNIYDQLNNISKCLFEICKDDNSPNIVNFKCMREYINDCMVNYKKVVDEAKNSQNITLIDDSDDTELSQIAIKEYSDFAHKVK